MPVKIQRQATDPRSSQIAKFDLLVQALHAEPQLEFAVLVGSRAADTALQKSDWDIALQWSAGLDWLDVLGKTETLRRKLAKTMCVETADIDLIELRRANLAMRATVTERGLSLTGENTLAWAHFLTRTWRELEDYYWAQRRAA